MTDIEKAIELINTVYETDGGDVGGYGHIVFDDLNIENANILYCLKSAYYSEFSDTISEECRLASIEALEFFLNLTEMEREVILASR